MSLYSIEPDFSGLNISHSEEIIDRVLPDFVDRTRDFALAIASQQSMSIKSFDFIQKGLSIRQEGPRILVETEFKADFFEKGWQSFDLGTEILNNSMHTKVAKDGTRYVHVPVYQGGLERVNPITEKGYRSRALHHGAMYSTENPYGIKHKTRNLVADARRYARAAGNLKYKNEKRPKYNTEGVFRTVSDKSQNWIHPGLDGFHFAQMAAEYMEEAIQNYINDFFE